MFNFQSMNAFTKNVLHEVMQSSQLLSSFAALGKEVQLGPSMMKPSNFPD